MKTLLTTLAAAILALAVGGVVQAGQPSQHQEPKHTDYRFPQKGDSHWRDGRRDRFDYRTYREFPVCDAPVCDCPVCDQPACDCPVCEQPVCECPIAEFPIYEYLHWDSRHRREHPLNRGGEEKVVKGSPTRHR